MVGFSSDGKRNDKRVEVKCEDVSLLWFYRTLNLKRLGVKIKKQDSGGHAGNKVLPITDSSSGDSLQYSDDLRPHKSGAVARMKELGKYGLGRMLMNFKKKPSSRDDDQQGIESPKISFKLDMETSSSPPRLQNADALNSTSFTFRNEAGNWITTDSEFVVLEL